MQTITTHTDAAATAPIRDRWQRFTAALRRGFDAQTRHRSRRDKIEALEAKTDAELARMGIRRDEIAYHVFRDLFYV